MKIDKRVLAPMDMPYVAARLDSPSFQGVVFASEARGGACVYHPDAGPAETVWTEPGGVMNVVPDGDEAALWSIQRFFPIFDSADAAIVRTARTADGVWESTVMARLPYVHRIARFAAGGRPYLLACTLCARKEYQDDWTSPGAVYAAPIVPGAPLDFKPVLEGLTKNHGLSFLGDAPIVSSADGVFRLDFAPDGGHRTERLHGRESSEAVLFDLDGDGERELVTIDGFHGDAVHIYKQGVLVKELPVTFGHVLWVGVLLGHRCVLVAGRGGDKATRIHFVPTRLDGDWECVTVDEGVGATQIAVTADGATLYAANHGAGETAAYRLSL